MLQGFFFSFVWKMFTIISTVAALSFHCFSNQKCACFITIVLWNENARKTIHPALPSGQKSLFRLRLVHRVSARRSMIINFILNENVSFQSPLSSISTLPSLSLVLSSTQNKSVKSSPLMKLLRRRKKFITLNQSLQFFQHFSSRLLILKRNERKEN